MKTQLAAGVHQSTVWQRLRDEHGLEASVASFRRCVRATLPEETRRAAVTVLRDGIPPGEEAQIDYGLLGTWVDPAGGRRRKVWAFVMVLPCSRHVFLQPTFVMDQTAWTQANVDAFAFFGGVPRRLVPDNLRTGVEQADLYDPKLNRSYAEMAAHYGVLIDPARRAKPKDKPHVERQVPYVRDSFWRGRDFTSLQQMRAQALRWCTDVAGARSCRPLGGARPLEVFTAVEAPALQPLPRKPFVIAAWSTAKVGPDIHAKVGQTLYSIPWRFIGQRVDARSTPMVVQFFHNGQLIATHGRKPRGKQTDFSHYPPEKIAFRMRTPTWCREQAAAIGPAATEVIAGLLAVGVLFRLRAAQGICGLTGKYPAARVEAACAKALAVGDPSYRTIKGILAAGTDIEPAATDGASRTGDAGAAAFLHGPSQLFANVIPMPTTTAPAAGDQATTTAPLELPTAGASDHHAG
ncbi:IS21 family transposase [Dactylosporangium salmoneum]|uniref:IS21 family transposase n=1 Tax=Dactylosporangium salmoneum TaxID=53361 RepID=A0ABP5TFG2_9ACTN